MTFMNLNKHFQMLILDTLFKLITILEDHCLCLIFKIQVPGPNKKWEELMDNMLFKWVKVTLLNLWTLGEIPLTSNLPSLSLETLSPKVSKSGS